ncbi:HNH endonuclease signature motif containing protein [Microtetraspora fusca]|uniref:HNH endonuclease signature motif containing protein n=1 Tax=Microtetraspora fusca TaxID=1997 RepID=UPI001FE1409B|nr:HNH endonuclease signature motif containing protein [Microtetraspora fusca]
MSGWALPAGLMSGRRLPGLLLATGQFLPVSDIHRLARTSSVARLVMDADSEILDMGRKVRRATAAQRRTILARYTSCMVDGCPLPAHLCQIDHIDNWSDGGATDLDRLGPTCQFHNRDRYRRPERYRLYRAGKDRWAFAYLGPRPTRRT